MLFLVKQTNVSHFKKVNIIFLHILFRGRNQTTEMEGLPTCFFLASGRVLAVNTFC